MKKIENLPEKQPMMTPPPTPNIIGPGKFGRLIDKEVREIIQKRIIQLEQEIIQLRKSDTIHKLRNQDKAFPKVGITRGMTAMPLDQIWQIWQIGEEEEDGEEEEELVHINPYPNPTMKY